MYHWPGHQHAIAANSRLRGGRLWVPGEGRSSGGCTPPRWPRRRANGTRRTPPAVSRASGCRRRTGDFLAGSRPAGDADAVAFRLEGKSSPPGRSGRAESDDDTAYDNCCYVTICSLVAVVPIIRTWSGSCGRFFPGWDGMPTPIHVLSAAVTRLLVVGRLRRRL